MPSYLRAAPFKQPQRVAPKRPTCPGLPHPVCCRQSHKPSTRPDPSPPRSLTPLFSGQGIFHACLTRSHAARTQNANTQLRLSIWLFRSSITSVGPGRAKLPTKSVFAAHPINQHARPSGEGLSVHSFRHAADKIHARTLLSTKAASKVGGPLHTHLRVRTR